MTPGSPSGYLCDVKSRGMLSLIHAAICSGPVFFLIAAYFAGPKDQTSPLVEIGWAYGCLAAAAGFFIPSVLGKFTASPDPNRSGAGLVPKIIQWATVESGALINGVSYFLTGNQTSAGAAIALTLLLVYFRPTDGEGATST